MRNKLMLALLALTLSGCGLEPRMTAPVAGSQKAIAQERTTEPMGRTDLQGELVSFEQGTAEYRLKLRLEDGSKTVEVLVPAQLTMRVVRGQFVGLGKGVPLSFLYDGAAVRLNLVSPNGNPLRAREIFWDMTGIPI